MAAEASGPHLPADQRQPHGFRQARQPERQGHAGRGDRPHQGDPATAGFHDPHRRHHAFVEGCRVRRRRQDHLGRQARRALRAGRARHPRRGGQVLQRALRPRLQGRRLVQLRRRRRALRRPGQRQEPQGRRHGLARRGPAQVARRRPQGQDRVDSGGAVRAHPALGGVRAMGLGHRRRRPRARHAQGLRLGHRAQRAHPSGDAEGRRQRRRSTPRARRRFRSLRRERRRRPAR